MITDVVCDKLLNAMNKITFPTAQVLLDLEQKQYSITGSTQMFHVGSLELRTDSQPYARRHPRTVGQRSVLVSDDQFLSKPTGPRRCPPERNVLDGSGRGSSRAKLPDIHCTSLMYRSCTFAILSRVVSVTVVIMCFTKVVSEITSVDTRPP